jgi:hypothetical protein
MKRVSVRSHARGPARPARPAPAARAIAAAAALLGTVCMLGLLAGPAAAYISSLGSGAGSSHVASLGAPALAKASVSGKTVTLSWSAVPAPASGSVAYYVLRDGGAPEGTCPGAAAPSTATSCTDSGLSPGKHSYTVVAVWRTWSTTSNATEATIANPLTQSIKFTSSAPSKARAGESTYKVTATATSGLPVSLAVAPSSASICSLSGATSGSTVTTAALGTCTIDANQEGNESYEAATQVQQSFTVARGAQTIEFTSAAPTSATVGAASYEVTAAASSGLPVSLAIELSSRNVCSISGSASGSRVSFTGTGTCTIAASQSGNTSFEAATTVKQSFHVGKTEQTIEFTSTPPNEPLVGSSYTVSAKSSAELAVSLAIASSSRSVCSLSGARVSFTHAGLCTIDATQSGDSTYEAAQAEQSFFVGVKLAITSDERSGSSYSLIGEGFPEEAVNIEVCKVDAFPCPSIDLAGTATAVVEAGGAWTSGRLSLSRTSSYWARATEAESGAISGPYSF